MRERLESGDIDQDPADDELAARLGSIRYRLTARGQIRIESKEDMKKRGLPSPDRADSLVYAYASSEDRREWRRRSGLAGGYRPGRAQPVAGLSSARP